MSKKLKTGQKYSFGQHLVELRQLIATRRSPSKKLLDTLRDFCTHDDCAAGASPVCLPATAVEVCAPIINHICEKDTDDSRKILRVAHYLLRRVLSSPHGRGIPKDVIESIVATLKSREMTHKHFPRRMEALRTLASCLRCTREPETFLNQLLVLVRSGLKDCLTWEQRVSVAKRRKEILTLHQELWLAQAYFSSSAYIVHHSFDQASRASSAELLEYYIFGICSKSVPVARNCASQLLALASSQPELVATKLAPLLPQHHSMHDVLQLSDEFVCVKMLDTFCCLASGKSVVVIKNHNRSREYREQFSEAIAFVLATDERWRVVLHAIRALANVSWSAIKNSQMFVDESGDVVGVSLHQSNSMNTNNIIGTNNHLMPLALMDRVINQLSNGLVRGLNILSHLSSDHMNHEKDIKSKQVQEGLSENQPCLFVHTVLRTIAAVGRCHAVHLVQSKSAQFVIDVPSRGTDALQTVLAPNLWKLAISSSDSIRLQSLLALVWLAPSPPESVVTDAEKTCYHLSKDPKNHADWTQTQSTLDDLELLLEKTPPLPQELAQELLRQFRGRVALSPTLSPLLLRWRHFLVGREVSVGGTISIWQTCLRLGDFARSALLSSLFDIINGDQPSFIGNKNVTFEDSNRSRLSHLRLRRAALWMLGQHGVQLCGPSEIAWLKHHSTTIMDHGNNRIGGDGGERGGGGVFELDFGLNQNKNSVELPNDLDEILTTTVNNGDPDVGNPAMRSILLLLLTSLQCDDLQSRRASALALASIGLDSCATVALKVIVRDIFCRLVKSSTFRNLSLDDITIPVLAHLESMLQIERSRVKEGTWKPIQISVVYPLRDQLESKLAGSKKVEEVEKVEKVEQIEEIKEAKEVDNFKLVTDTSMDNTNTGGIEETENMTSKVRVPEKNIWTISEKQNAKYIMHYNNLVSSSEVEDPPSLAHVLPFFERSMLPREKIMKVWMLVNIKHESQIVSLEQFKVAFHIVTAIAVLNVEVPTALSPDLKSLVEDVPKVVKSVTEPLVLLDHLSDSNTKKNQPLLPDDFAGRFVDGGFVDIEFADGGFNGDFDGDFDNDLDSSFLGGGFFVTNGQDDFSGGGQFDGGQFDGGQFDGDLGQHQKNPQQMQQDISPPSVQAVVNDEKNRKSSDLIDIFENSSNTFDTTKDGVKTKMQYFNNHLEHGDDNCFALSGNTFKEQGFSNFPGTQKPRRGDDVGTIGKNFGTFSAFQNINSRGDIHNPNTESDSGMNFTQRRYEQNPVMPNDTPELISFEQSLAMELAKQYGTQEAEGDITNARNSEVNNNRFQNGFSLENMFHNNPSGPIGPLTQEPSQMSNYGSLEDQTYFLNSLFQSVARPKTFLSGMEAVNFLRRSGLKDTALRQIWEVSAKGSGVLSLEGFREAMRLVSKLQSLNSQQEQDDFVSNMCSFVNRNERLPLPVLHE
jgi:hypothetical protein